MSGLLKSTVLPSLCIMIVGSAIGMGVNAVRTEDSISYRRNYFRTALVENTGGAGERSTDADEDSHNDGARKHPYTVATVEDMMDFFESPGYQYGDIVFVDARRDSTFREGHIPDAVRLDNYNFDRDYDSAKDIINSATTVVVYCNGGECSDSIYVATALESMGVQRSKLHLFEGGIVEWIANGLPIEASDLVEQASSIDDDIDPAEEG